ncbi:MAG: protein-disulfide reductase DsbD domain-containing protein [Verrucomicrobiota bacterium]|jgi:thiol:disulfide interchange protein DsbD
MKWLCLNLLGGLLALPGLAQSDFLGAATGHTQARLLLAAETAKPGDTVWAGVELKMDPHWHTYWRFGGDAGIATTVTWTLPAGVSAGEIAWPVPQKTENKAGGLSLFTYGYDDQVVLLAPIKLDASLPAGPVRLRAALTWLECEDKGLCVPAKSEVSGMITVGAAEKPSTAAALIEQWRGRSPRIGAAVHATARWEAISPGDTRTVMIDWESADRPGDFYPYENQSADVQGATERPTAPPGHIFLRKVLKKGDGPWPERLAGILVGRSDSPNPAAVEVSLPLSNPPATAPPPAAAPASLVLMLLFAFAGGLILNVMPCVLPVIALKVLGFVNQSTESPERVRRLGLVYGLGVLVSFAALAGLAIAAQRAGGLASWGDAFRNPQFQVVLTVLMALIALNLFGVFEISLGAGVMGSAAGLASRPGLPGAFFNGVLATVLATPCTAPFLGAAVAFAFTQPPGVTVLVFLAAGAGLAFPFVAICWEPRLLKALPKPGAWMEKFKIAMGFPMLAAAVWLVWVTSRNAEDALWLELFLLTLALAAWIWGAFVQRGTRRRILAAAVSLLLLAAGYGAILEGELEWRLPANAPREGIAWKVWSPEAVAQARREGHPALVDFTARSCLTCKLNKGSSLEIPQTRAKLKAIGAVAFEADFTYEDPQILAELRRHNASGVPLVLVYSKDPGRDPQVLPTFLTPSIVLNALDLAAK